MEAKFKALLKDKKLKFTKRRFAIFKALKSSNVPQCYEQIKSNLAMDKATFYRNMIKFEECGIVNKFEANDKKWYYELSNKHHAHFICEKCNTIACMDIEIPSKLNEYQISSMVFKGKCKNCT